MEKPPLSLTRPAATSGALFGFLWLCWLAQAFGFAANTTSIGRWIALIWLLVSMPTGVQALARWLRPTSAAERQRRRMLLVVLTVALLVRFAGADHEVGERAYQDEGTYYHHAQEINQGKPWRYSFVYGHVSYYAGAFGLWLTELFPSAYTTLATTWSGTAEPLAHQWLTLRLLVALLSALTVLPVFGIAWLLTSLPNAHEPSQSALEPDSEPQVSPLAAATAASALFIASPVFNEGSHLIISDYPSACFATFALYFVARFSLRQPSPATPNNELSAWRSYGLAGAFAGLAAATKYPAGTVAVAIVVGWVYRLWRNRDNSSSAVLQRPSNSSPLFSHLAVLFLSGATALTVFLVSMPTFLRDPYHAIFSPRGMLFGLRQYSKGGWIGVMPESQLEYYFKLCVEAVGLVALLSLILAPLIMTARLRRRWLVTATYPTLYLALLLAMSMVVKRNLAPAIPILATLAGVALVATATKIAGRWAGPQRTACTTALVVLALAAPTWATAHQLVGLTRLSTREVALRWMVDSLPRGTRVLRESYTPRLPPDHFFLRKARFAAKVPTEEIEAEQYQYVLLAGNAFGRFLDPDQHTQPHHGVMAQRYRYMFDHYQEVKTFEPGPWRRGPTLWLLKVVPRESASDQALDSR